jgi:predicted acylesterase/phospholipase RssA
MSRLDVRPLVWLALALVVPACQTPPERQCNLVNRVPATDLVDPTRGADTVPVLDVKVSDAMAAQTQWSEVRPVSATSGKKPFNVLVLSGGGAYGAFSAGVLAGWAESGTRPDFDVVTGVSTGALVATLAFLGPDWDPALKRFYTGVKDDDIFARNTYLAALFSDSFRDSKPLAKLIEWIVDDKILAAIAAEHAKGRRLYVGTTHLDSRRLVVWDMGEIASRGRPQDLALFRKVLLASAAIPGFFPPVTINVDIDGKPAEELHVDGGVTASLFFRSPHVAPDQLRRLGERPLEGSNVYAIVAGKLYADPGCVERRLLPIAADSISALLYSQCRGDLFQLYALALATGMNYRVTSIPVELDVPMDATSFDPKAMGWLYEQGREQAKSGKLWRTTPPGTEPGEEVPIRGGTQLKSLPNRGKNSAPATTGR